MAYSQSQLDAVKKELDEVKADLSKSWATISDLKEQNEKLKEEIEEKEEEVSLINSEEMENEEEIAKLKEECKQMMDENGKTMRIAMGWREKYGDLKERCDEFPTENEMGLNVCDLDEIIKVQKDENATIGEELEKVKEIARRQSKWIVNAKQVIKMSKEVLDEEYCAKYCRCGTEWSPDFRDNPKVADGVYCKKCSGGEEETFYFSCDEEGYTFFDDANSLIKNTPRMEDCYVFYGRTTKERIEEGDDDYKEVNVEEYLAENK